MQVREHFEYYDEKAGVDNLVLFGAGEVHILEKVKAYHWPYWTELFRLCLDVMRESYADDELKEPFGPDEYRVFRRIVRGGFARFQKKRPGVRVPEIWRYVEGWLDRREKGLPETP